MWANEVKKRKKKIIIIVSLVVISIISILGVCWYLKQKTKTTSNSICANDSENFTKSTIEIADIRRVEIPSLWLEILKEEKEKEALKQDFLKKAQKVKEKLEKQKNELGSEQNEQDKPKNLIKTKINIISGLSENSDPLNFVSQSITDQIPELKDDYNNFVTKTKTADNNITNRKKEIKNKYSKRKSLIATQVLEQFLKELNNWISKIPEKEVLFDYLHRAINEIKYYLSLSSSFNNNFDAIINFVTKIQIAKNKLINELYKTLEEFKNIINVNYGKTEIDNGKLTFENIISKEITTINLQNSNSNLYFGWSEDMKENFKNKFCQQVLDVPNEWSAFQDHFNTETNFNRFIKTKINYNPQNNEEFIKEVYQCFYIIDCPLLINNKDPKIPLDFLNDIFKCGFETRDKGQMVINESNSNF
ncbi:hypothetical protein [Candidatus Phytoplasma meliae]|uniref:Uncharacterized protein n=1 Tax=Candidatus Phytoplasma meliae TaxID=1848402 RepID=A0ABS5CXL6_9MOLU|nr:hypothetical protein [Candidatus Phytoplasma meliae]MBP5835709.1 hypothetical protein [Candidatus Phytoplasma meliae]